jgi:hypothetical protein
MHIPVKRTHTPVLLSPFSRHLGTGAAPRYLGKRLGWIFSVPNLGMDRNLDGKKLPYAAVMQRSGFREVSDSMNAASPAFSGVNTFKPTLQVKILHTECFTRRIEW